MGDEAQAQGGRRSTAQIGRCGELLVQYHLLKLGIESAPMTTDVGVDLVAYSPSRRRAYTVQVKTNLQSKPSGGKGKAGLDWWIREDSPADLVALVDLSADRIWLMSHANLMKHAQQRSSGRAHVYMYTDPAVRPRKSDRRSHLREFEDFLLYNCASALLVD